MSWFNKSPREISHIYIYITGEEEKRLECLKMKKKQKKEANLNLPNPLKIFVIMFIRNYGFRVKSHGSTWS